MSFRTLVEAALQAVGGDVRDLQASRAGLAPRVGWSVTGSNHLGTTAGTLVFQRGTFVPYLVGPIPWVSDAALFVVSTAYANAQSDTNLAIGVYADNGTGFPKFAGGPVSSAAVPFSGLNTTGTKTAVLNAVANLKPGLYWIGTLLGGTSAPTAGQIQCITNNSYQLPVPANFAPGSTTRAYIWSGLTALPTTDPASVSTISVSGNNDAPSMSLRRSA